MLSKDYWNCFMDSGIPEYYLLYIKARRMENPDVPDNKGVSIAGQSLQ